MKKALKNIGIDFELVNYCEIDKHASKSYSKIHNVSEVLNLGDITKVDIQSLPKVDMITHGSPCQDFSLAGKGKGGDIDSNTRSSLMWNSVEIIKHCKPKYVIWENVKNVLSNKHRHNFDKYLEELGKLGYSSYYKVLNSKDFGIPQNRERVFVVSVIGDINFDFPIPKLPTCLFEILDEYVDFKYYISIEQFIKHNINNIEKLSEKSVADFRYDEGFRVRKNGLSPTLTCKVGSSGLSSNPLIINNRIFDRFIDNSSTNTTGIGNNPCSREYNGVKNISPTLCARDFKDPKIVKFENQGLTIRKLTPKRMF